MNYKHTFTSVWLSRVSQLRVKETNPANKDKEFGSYCVLKSQGTFIWAVDLTLVISSHIKAQVFCLHCSCVSSLVPSAEVFNMPLRTSEPWLPVWGRVVLLCAERKLSLPPASTANFKCQEKNPRDDSIAILNFYRRLAWYKVFWFPFKLSVACVVWTQGWEVGECLLSGQGFVSEW